MHLAMPLPLSTDRSIQTEDEERPLTHGVMASRAVRRGCSVCFRLSPLGESIVSPLGEGLVGNNSANK